ncbi:M20/M25/M40 family metallo-hydrolase [archaeon]|nr:MAG: M20/M25/M40 family metallo-hydrolase [archaeon]
MHARTPSAPCAAPICRCFFGVCGDVRACCRVHVCVTKSLTRRSMYVPPPVRALALATLQLRFANHMMELREGERKKLEATCGCGKQLGDFTTINMTMMRAGDATRFQYNVIPIEAEAGFDCRIPATVNLEEFKAQIDAWAAEEPGVTWELVSGTGEGATENPVSDVSSDSYWWGVFQGACKDAGAELCEPSIFPAATDSRWIRLALGTPCFGFSPMRRLPILLHDHDEYITRESFLEGIDIYTKLIPALADALGEKAGVGATAPGMESCVRE